MDETLHALAVANRILAREDVVDVYGHVSVRHPDDPRRYILSRSRSPALVTPEDLMEYSLEGEVLTRTSLRPYAERAIHGAVYEARADVHAVIHNHSRAVIPFGVTATPIRPVFHNAAGIGQGTPIWDIRDRFGDTSMLVTTVEQGRDLARSLGDGRVVLMRGHGCTVCGPNLKEAVMVAVYLQVNAALQMEALRLGEPRYLSAEEERLYSEIHFSPLSVDRAWEYFCARADLKGL